MKVDKQATAELARERELLTVVTKFLGATIKHYTLDAYEATDDANNVGKFVLANAILMRALGRTLWKVSQTLLKHRKGGGLSFWRLQIRWIVRSATMTRRLTVRVMALSSAGRCSDAD